MSIKCQKCLNKTKVLTVAGDTRIRLCLSCGYRGTTRETWTSALPVQAPTPVRPSPKYMYEHHLEDGGTMGVQQWIDAGCPPGPRYQPR